MKVSLNWLSDYLDVSLPVRELAALFTRIGFGPEEILETDSDIVLDLEVTSNRPDLLGHLGVARELATATGAAFNPPHVPEPPAGGEISNLTSVEVRDGALCPRYTARLIRGVKVGPSPSWMVERLESAGLRSVNNIVDVTNYVLLEYSQPLHSFDFAKLRGGRIVVRRARPGEELVSIDGTTCRLDEEMLVIADAERPVAIAGVMGGLNTEVTAETTEILLESARFDPLSTRRTSRKLALMSESNYRFERGVDPVGVEVASRRACDLICRLAGGEVAEGLIDVWQRPWQPQEVTLRPRRTCDLLGFEVSPERQVEILEGLGTNPRMREGAIVCTPPSYRSDLTREADLIEEVARMEGYDRIPVREAIRHAVVPETPRQRTTVRVQRALAAAGFDEAITPAYLEPSENELFGLDRSICVDPNHRRTHGALRGTLLPSLMAVCKTNQDAGVEELSVYELASIFPPGGPDGRPDERIELAMATTLGLRRLRGAIEAMVEDLAPRARLEVRPGQQAGFDSAAAELFVDDEPLGRMGRIDGKVQDRYGLEKPVCGAALRFERLLELGTAERGYEPIPRLPAVQRDLSLIVDEPVRWADLLAAVDQRPQALREAVDYVTTYRGKPVPAGRKSVTIRLRYRAADQTLRGEQVDELVGDLVEHLCDRLNAELRT